MLPGEWLLDMLLLRHLLVVLSRLINDGDSITIDAHERLIQLNIGQEELELRKAAFKTIFKNIKSGLLAKYSRLVTTASQGAITDAQD